MFTTPIRTSALIGPALDWAVAKCEKPEWFGNQAEVYVTKCDYHPSLYWSLAGPIIEREDIVIIRECDDYGTDSEGFTTRERIKVWRAVIDKGGQQPTWSRDFECSVLWYNTFDGCSGPTPLIAAMRCYVASKLGDVVEIPNELL